MASEKNNPTRSPMYPQVIDPNYETTLPPSSSSPSSRPNLYPTIDMKDLVENLFPDVNDETPPANISSAPSAPPESMEETLLTVPGAILHLIDKQYSVELATGDLVILRLRQGDNTVAVLARVADEIQWPLTKDLAAVKLDPSRYFFSFCAPIEGEGSDSSSDDEIDDKRQKQKQKKKKKKKKNRKESENIESLDVLNYGLTIASKGQEDLLKQLDGVLEISSSFSVQQVEEKVVAQLGGAVAREVSPADLVSEKKKEVLEERCAAYWTTLAPNVEEYSGTAAKLIAAGSGQLVKGILWCGDVTVDRLKWGNEVLKTRMTTGSKAEVSPDTLRRIKRVKRVTKMTEKVALGVLSGVVKVSGFFTSSVANSKAGKKFFGLLPGEMVLASLDGFSKICDAVEVAGKNVMSTSSTVTTGLVSHRYGEEAAKAASEGLDAAGHAVGTAWAVFKIRKALNPKGVLSPRSLAKSAAKSVAAEKKAKSSKK
ncbi:protein EARLY-RESPONSIVE TO DEHYDRATION 7, chloroplastic-like [Coffea eugenioides]|uniref:protein EARLY-RESPONSIVE TO DEHYDRATION 7, chloroplastic-like n=1 Tax=Coffea eugenioides TaxID=49369 RepID=UPI000F60E1BE|nr:protein EARLY-RESPONSIVE TO DEHYDRATION 7, chloroplastic-like [Coffea eugenioides]